MHPTLTLPSAGLDPDREEARRWLETEIAEGDYRLQEPVLTRLWNWFVDLLPSVALPGQLPAWTPWVVLVLVLVVAAAVIAFGLRDRWRTGRLSGSRTNGAVLDGVHRAASQYRASAEAALRRGDHDTAALEAYRAIAAGAIERTLLDNRPGQTAHEVAASLVPVFPAHGGPLGLAADTFDAVRYGDQRCDADTARELLELETAVRGSRPQLDAAPRLSGVGR